MDAARARERLHADEDGGEDSGGDPDAEVVSDVVDGIRRQVGLRDSREDGEQAGGGKRGSAIAAEFRGARNLAANAGDIAECLVEGMNWEAHRNSLYTAK